MSTPYFDPVAHTPLRGITDFGFSDPGMLFGAGRSDSVGVPGTNYVFDKTTGSWVVTSPVNFGGYVDWHGGGETIRWAGPRSRYWFRSDVSPASQLAWTVYRGEFIWAQSLFGGDVLGAAIMESGGTKYLTIVVIDAFGGNNVQVQQREFAVTYPDHGFYHATNNPLGWKELGSFNVIRNFISQPCFFNESGTEGQFIWRHTNVNGDAKRIKVTVGVGSASFEEIDDLGAGHDVVSSATFARHENIDKGILAVDYIGDVETPAYTYITRNDTYEKSGNLTSTQDGDTWNVNTETHADTKYVVEFASRIFYHRESYLDSQTSENWTTIGGFSGSKSSTVTRNEDVWRFIFYMDLRDDTIVYNEERTNAPSTGVSQNVDPVTQDFEMAVTSTRSYWYKYLIDQAGNLEEAYTQAVVDDDVSTTLFNQGPDFPPSGGGGSTTTPADLGKQFGMAFLHNQSVRLYQGAMGAAQDGAGNLLWSTTQWVKATVGASYTDGGKFNFLTGGDPVALSGLPGANPWFDRVALVKY